MTWYHIYIYIHICGIIIWVVYAGSIHGSLGGSLGVGVGVPFTENMANHPATRRIWLG